MAKEIRQAYPHLKFRTDLTRSTDEFLLKYGNKQMEEFSKSFKLKGQDVPLLRKVPQTTSWVTFLLPQTIPAETIMAPNRLKTVCSSHKELTAEGQQTVQTKTFTLTFQGQAQNSVKTQYSSFKTKQTFCRTTSMLQVPAEWPQPVQMHGGGAVCVCAAHHDSDVCLKSPMSCPEQLRRLPKAALKVVQDIEEKAENKKKTELKTKKAETKIKKKAETLMKKTPKKKVEKKAQTPKKKVEIKKNAVTPKVKSMVVVVVTPLPSDTPKHTAATASLTPPSQPHA
jgi:hypothetical protein